ncbi:MFS transporter [Streptomyces sp. NBC_01727]|uniref:MFS transporter n=1 Tax=Streptomyces sp. NBC_01727 TaxID=2975924 RepID=UPI002E14B89D|nr:MFS transporter [Streptomyces sp. NBC_01727]
MSAHDSGAVDSRSRTGAGGDTALILALGLGATVVAMTHTLVIPITGLMQHQLHATASGISWVTTATLLSAAVFTPLLGRFGDQHGKRSTLLGLLAAAVVGALLGAWSGSLGWLIAGRVLQGAATAVFPLALSILREEVNPRRLPGAMAVVSGSLAFGSGLSYVLTGLLTRDANADYRTVFWLAAGLSAVALAAAAVFVQHTRIRPGGRTDFLGALTLAAFLVLLLLPVSQGNRWGWTSAATLSCFAVAVLVLPLWVTTERRVKEPMVDLRMFLRRPILMTNLAGLFVGFAMFAQFLGVAVLAQAPEHVTAYGFGESILKTSMAYLLPSSTAALIASQFGGRIIHRVGARSTLLGSGALGCTGFVWLAAFHSIPASVIGAAVVLGIAVSLGYAAMPALIVANVPLSQTGVANGINSISRSSGGAIGSAVVATLLASRTAVGLRPGASVLPAESQITWTFALGAIAFAAVTLIASVGLMRASGRTTDVAGRAVVDRVSAVAAARQRSGA